MSAAQAGQPQAANGLLELLATEDIPDGGATYLNLLAPAVEQPAVRKARSRSFARCAWALGLGGEHTADDFHAPGQLLGRSGKGGQQAHHIAAGRWREQAGLAQRGHVGDRVAGELKS